MNTSAKAKVTVLGKRQVVNGLTGFAIRISMRNPVATRSVIGLKPRFQMQAGQSSAIHPKKIPHPTFHDCLNFVSNRYH
jgi:hypothetical protein